uniref:Uncharacterized protein n=1 Tax=Lepeophtheirus salmonis TaxID=72036 RepID=A0A0K2T9K1_LEPSM
MRPHPRDLALIPTSSTQPFRYMSREGMHCLSSKHQDCQGHYCLSVLARHDR